MKTNMKNKWRLPTVEELENVLYPNMGKIPNLKKDSSYWSSSEYASFSACSFYFFIGRAGFSVKHDAILVRAVRDILNDSPNLSNSTIVGNLEIYNTDLGKMSWNEARAAVKKLNHNIS
jgi:hypothetical protein